MNVIRTILVDDEPAAHERMRALLSRHPAVEVVGIAHDVEAARRLCALHQPDLVFLDVRLRHQNGFELAAELPATTKVVVVSASEVFALTAFEFQVRDYLLKPVSPARLAASLDRLFADSAEDEKQIELNDGVTRRFIPMDAVTHIEALDNYATVFMSDGTHCLMRKSLNAWEATLPPSRFFRIHRSLIIRLDAVRLISRQSRDSCSVSLLGRDEVLELGRLSARRLTRELKARSSEPSPQIRPGSPHDQ